MRRQAHGIHSKNEGLRFIEGRDCGFVEINLNTVRTV